MILLLLACHGADPDDTAGDSATDTGADSGETGDPSACDLGAAAAAWLDPPTTVGVTWGVPLEDAVVEFGEDTGYGRTIPATTAQTAAIPFLGAGVDWHVRVRGTHDGTACVSPDLPVSVPPPSASLPGLVTTIPRDPDPTAPLLVTTVQGAHYAAVVLDDQGRYAWWLEASAGGGFDNVRVSADGEGVWVMARTFSDPSMVHLQYKPWGAPMKEDIPVARGHHDFVEVGVDGDRFAVLVSEQRQLDGEEVVGDSIVIIGDDGSFRTIWSAFDEWPVEPNIGWEQSTYPGAADWTHANSLVYVPDQDAFLVSLHFVPAVVLIGRDGVRRWTFGEGPGIPSDFTFADGAPGQMHSPSLTDAGLLLFENGSSDERESTITEFAVDWDARTASRLWSATPGEGSYAYILGDAERLADGSTLSTWGSLGLVEAFAADGTPTWKLNLGLGSLFGFFETMDPPWASAG